MMPKGVDHLNNAVLLFWGFGVQKSLMPKGVDHLRLNSFCLTSSRVQKSLMPKGVDHHIKFLRAGRSGQKGAKIFDSERR